MAQTNSKQYRVIVADFHQETNSFNGRNWTFEDFRHDTFLEGEEIVTRYGTNTGRVLCGIIQSCLEHNAQIIPACALRSTSGGPVEFEVVEYFLEKLLACYEANAPVDAFILSLHGATQSTQEDDVCGYILRQIRARVGRDMVISVGCDLHANVTEQCVEHADFICGFQTYPHVDQTGTGYRAAQLAFEKLQTGATRYLARTCLPMIVPASGYTTKQEPLRSIVQHAHDLVAEGKLRDFSIFHMQPWLDVDPAGSAIVTIGDDADVVRDAAAELAKRVFAIREQMWPELCSVDEVIDLAAGAPQDKPVVLVDFADSLGAGAPGDSVSALLSLQAKGYPVSATTVVTDSEAVAAAWKVGEGNTAEFTLGSEISGRATVQATVRSLQEDGVFYQEGPVAPGQRRDLGRLAILRVENVDVLICEHACGTGDLQVYRHFGIEPTAYQMVVVKANTSFRAAYEPIASAICMTSTPGAATSQLTQLHYTHIRRPFYPFDNMEGMVVPTPQIFTR